MKIRFLMIAVVLLVFSPVYVFAQKGEQKQEAMEVGNTICPVSGEKIGGEMGEGVKVEYNGKIYNLCCPACLATFKADPEKYVKIVEEQMGQGSAKEPGDVHEHHGDKGPGEHAAMPAQASEGMQAAAMTESPGPEVKEFDIEAYKFGYSPERIVVRKGDTVKLHATSKDVPHGILIKEYGINERVEKGKVTDIEFVADKAGTFEIRCSVYCGAGHRNMKAQLVVE